MFETVILACIAIGILYVGQALFIPIALAVFLTFLLSPAVTKLRQFRVPKVLAVTSVAVISFLLFATLGFLIGRQVTGFAEDLPRYKLTLVDKIQTLKTLAATGPAMERAADTLKSLRKAIEQDQSSPSVGQSQTSTEKIEQPAKVQIENPATPLDQLRKTAEVVASPLLSIGIVLLFVVVVLLYREDVRDRAIRLLGVRDLARTTKAMDDAGSRLNRYFLATTTINVTFGVVIGTGLWLIGIPNPILWAVVAAILRFVPFIGVPIAAIIPVLLSIVVDPGWTMLAYTIALFVISEILISQAIEPLIHGEATGLSPLAIILATTFWTLLWGPVGLVLAVPLTVMLVVLGRHGEQFAIFDILLGAEPALTPPDRFYQRILANDPEEAADQAESHLQTMSLVEYYDAIVLNGLKRAADDFDTGQLDNPRLSELKHSLDRFFENAAELMESKAVNQSLSPIPGDYPILCIGARNKLDDAAATMLNQTLAAKGLNAQTYTQATLPQDVGHCIICLSAFDTGRRSGQTRFLIRRLRRVFPSAFIIACFWRANVEHDIPDGAATLQADELVTTLSSAIDCCSLKMFELTKAVA